MYGVESTGHMQSGPNETTWSIDGVSAWPRAMRAAGRRHPLRLDRRPSRHPVDALFDLDGDYENTYNLWVDAGPWIARSRSGYWHR